MIVVRSLSIEDVAEVAARARQCDIDEIAAGNGWTILQALEHGLQESERALLIEADGIPMAALGDVVLEEGVALPWLIGTIHLEEHAAGFLRATRRIVGEMLERHQVLVNWVDARNTVAIRWLEWLGFSVGDPVPAGIAGLPFAQFILTRPISAAGKACTGSDLSAPLH